MQYEHILDPHFTSISAGYEILAQMRSLKLVTYWPIPIKFLGYMQVRSKTTFTNQILSPSCNR